uniref:Uncharacterized protein n=1 Tax=Avena sativa TaxID=4498 RepID=A0ACD5XA12_AVESA
MMSPTSTKLDKLRLLLLVVSFSTIHGQAVRRPGSHAIGIRSTACLPRERDALLAFKRGFTSDPAGQLASWRLRGGQEEDCCRWRGVWCSNRTGHVVGIHLPNTHADDCTGIDCAQTALVGHISPSLLSLQHLSHLDLSVQLLQGRTGRVPSFLGSLSSLRYLNLSCVPFSGSLPPQIGNLSNLHHLDLSQSYSAYYLLGSIVPTYSTDISWLGRLTSLRYLDMESVDLSMVADWPHVVNMIPSLRILYLSQCSLQSANQSLPQYLNLTNLEELDLFGNNFSQPIASCWFWNITSLRYLGLRFTNLYGPIPNTLGDLKSLQTFGLSTNTIGSMTSSSMRNLCNLEILDIRNSLLDENIGDILERLPRCSPNKLRELYLAHNNIKGILPSWIREFESIAVLDLSHNLLTGPLPSEIGVLNHLTYLGLSSNNFGGILTQDHFANLSSLRYIDLSHASVNITVDLDWQPPFILEAAFFASCQMGPMFPPWLKWQVGLSYLDISSTGITDRLPEWFCTTFASISFLDISNNEISGILPTNMEVMTSLEELYLDSNKISGQIPRLPAILGILDISNNSFSGPLPVSFCKLRELVILDLSNNLLEGAFPRCFEPRKVKTLILSNNGLSGMLPPFLRRCKDLSVLDLSWNKFSGRLPMWIGDSVSLQILQLSHNMFSQSIPATIANLSNLFHLDIAGNSLSGFIPRQLSNLTGFTHMGAPSFLPPSLSVSVITKGQELHYSDGFFDRMVTIDLSSNFLTGGIPKEIDTLDAVINLNLSWNELSGRISDKIGVITSLQSLDLSRNKFYGEIPASLSNLTYLSRLDLSYNDLTGGIPSEGQLDTLYLEYPSMYDGNNGLCGPPLRKNCSSNNTPRKDVQKTIDRYSDQMFFYFGITIGYVTGLWLVFCAMLFKKHGGILISASLTRYTINCMCLSLSLGKYLRFLKLVGKIGSKSIGDRVLQNKFCIPTWSIEKCKIVSWKNKE